MINFTLQNCIMTEIRNLRLVTLSGWLKLVTLVLLGVLCLYSCTPKSSGSEEDILKVCEETDKNLGSYTHRSMDGYPEPEKRKFNVYYKGKLPRLLIEEYYSDSARVFTRYYLDGDQMILAYQERFVYNRPTYMTEDSARNLGDTVWYDDHKTVLQTSTYVFNENKLKKWVGPDRKPVPSTDKMYNAKEEELVGNCLLMLKIFKSVEEQ